MNILKYYYTPIMDSSTSYSDFQSSYLSVLKSFHNSVSFSGADFACGKP